MNKKQKKITKRLFLKLAKYDFYDLSDEQLLGNRVNIENTLAFQWHLLGHYLGLFRKEIINEIKNIFNKRR